MHEKFQPIDAPYAWKGADLQNSTEWLRPFTPDELAEIGSKDGQDIFNPIKGSIPARTDEDKSKYTGYLTWALDEWGKDKLVGSFYHGVVANNAWHNDIDTAEGQFLKDWNVDSFQKALVNAAQQDAD